MSCDSRVDMARQMQPRTVDIISRLHSSTQIVYHVPVDRQRRLAIGLGIAAPLLLFAFLILFMLAKWNGWFQ